MEITLAKSQGYLKDQLKQPGLSSNKKLLAVIGVYTGFGSRLNRNVFRGSWMPKGDSLKKLEERGIVIRFVIGRRLSPHLNFYLFVILVVYGISFSFWMENLVIPIVKQRLP